MSSIPWQGFDFEGQRCDGVPRHEVRSPQSARTKSFEAVESFESLCEVADLAKLGSVTQ